MPKAKMNDDQWMNFINECRSSGMTDKDWCIMHDMHPSTLYKAINRLRKKACEIPDHGDRTVSLKQEVVEIASIDDNGLITQPSIFEATSRPASNPSTLSYDSFSASSSFETTVRIVMPSGIKVELSNSTTAATIRSILGALQSV